MLKGRLEFCIECYQRPGYPHFSVQQKTNSYFQLETNWCTMTAQLVSHFHSRTGTLISKAQSTGSLKEACHPQKFYKSSMGQCTLYKWYLAQSFLVVSWFEMKVVVDTIMSVQESDMTVLESLWFEGHHDSWMHWDTVTVKRNYDWQMALQQSSTVIFGFSMLLYMKTFDLV